MLVVFLMPTVMLFFVVNSIPAPSLCCLYLCHGLWFGSCRGSIASTPCVLVQLLILSMFCMILFSLIDVYVGVTCTGIPIRRLLGGRCGVLRQLVTELYQLLFIIGSLASGVRLLNSMFLHVAVMLSVNIGATSSRCFVGPYLFSATVGTLCAHTTRRPACAFSKSAI